MKSQLACASMKSMTDSEDKPAILTRPSGARQCMPGSIALLATILVALTGCATPAGKVDQWGISGSEVAELSGDVVDILCEVSGDCVERCGAGNRQLGIRTDEKVVLIAKDINNYTGGAEELWPFCNQPLTVNGQFTETGDTRFFQIQNVREPGGPWMSTTRFLEVWAEKNDKDLATAKRWYRHDPRVRTTLEQDGLLGLGEDVDRDYFGQQ